MEYVDIYKFNPKKDGAVAMLPESLRNMATKIHSNFEAELSSSKIDYDNIVKSIDEAQNVGQSEALISTYMRLKAESKLLLNVLESYNLKQIKLQKELYMNHSKGKTASTGIKFSEASSHYHQMLRELIASIKNTFHQNFDVDFDLIPDNRKKFVCLQNILELKESLLSKMCTSLLNDVGVDFVSDDNTITNENKLVGNGFGCILNMFKTFDSVNTKLKGMVLTKAENDFALALATKQLFINELEIENKKLQDDLAETTKRYQNLALEAGRQQIIIKQQFTIDQLNQRIEKLQNDIVILNEKNEKYFEEKQRQNDEIQLLTSQLQEAQTSYEIDISSIQPIIENHLFKTNLGKKEIDSLRNELGFRYSRVLVTEMKIHSALDEINRLRGVNSDLTKQRDDLIERVNELENELKYQERRYDDLQDKYQTLYETHKRLQNDFEVLGSKYDSKVNLLKLQIEEFKEVENYIEKLQSIIVRNEDKICDLNNAINTQKAKYDDQQQYIISLKANIKLLEEEGLSLEKQRELREKVRIIDELKEFQQKLEKQLRVALKRVSDLQDELQLYQAGLI